MPPFTPYTVTSPLEFDDSVTQYNLPASDTQEHLYSAITPAGPLVVVEHLRGATADKLRAEILMSVYAATERYAKLPGETKQFDQQAFKEAFDYAATRAHNEQ